LGTLSGGPCGTTAARRRSEEFGFGVEARDDVVVVDVVVDSSSS
jgi:hypothetical protein